MLVIYLLYNNITLKLSSYKTTNIYCLIVPGVQETGGSITGFLRPKISQKATTNVSGGDAVSSEGSARGGPTSMLTHIVFGCWQDSVLGSSLNERPQFPEASGQGPPQFLIMWASSCVAYNKAFGFAQNESKTEATFFQKSNLRINTPSFLSHSICYKQISRSRNHSREGDYTSNLLTGHEQKFTEEKYNEKCFKPHQQKGNAN